MSEKSKVEIRHQQICDLLNAEGMLSSVDLAKTFKVSESTMRSDLAKLDKLGLLHRTYGGAVANEYTSKNTVISTRLRLQKSEKSKIAEYVVEKYVKPGSIITLDSGTTTMLVAQKIFDQEIPCTVVTNSFLVADILSKSKYTNLYLAGGHYDPDHASFHDDVAIIIIKSVRSHFAFISPNGVDKNGLVTSSGIDENLIKQEMIKQADHAVILADNSKIENTELKIITTSKEVSLVITDQKTPQKSIDNLEKAGFIVKVAK